METIPPIHPAYRFQDAQPTVSSDYSFWNLQTTVSRSLAAIAPFGATGSFRSHPTKWWHPAEWVGFRVADRVRRWTGHRCYPRFGRVESAAWMWCYLRYRKGRICGMDMSGLGMGSAAPTGYLPRVVDPQMANSLRSPPAVMV